MYKQIQLIASGSISISAVPQSGYEGSRSAMPKTIAPCNPSLDLQMRWRGDPPPGVFRVPLLGCLWACAEASCCSLCCSSSSGGSASSRARRLGAVDTMIRTRSEPVWLSSASHRSSHLLISFLNEIHCFLCFMHKASPIPTSRTFSCYI